MFNIDISKEQSNRTNQIYLNDLKGLLKTNESVPTHTPKKLVDCFYLYKTGSSYYLYIFIDNTWKRTALT